MNMKQKITITIFFLLSLTLKAQIKIIPGGNVGVGQPNPTAKLEVLNPNEGLTFRMSTGATSPILDVWQTSLTSFPGERTSLLFHNGSFEIFDQSNSQTRFWINKNNGYVGIGTNNPDSKLTISTNNDIALSTYIQHAGSYGVASISKVNQSYSKSWVVQYSGNHKFFVYGNGQVYANGVWYGSDLSFKNNVLEIDKALVKIMKLKGVSYQLKKESDVVEEEYEDINLDVKKQLKEEKSRRHLGLIAQEVEQVFPEAVRTMPDGTKAVAYNQLIAVCIEAIKELSLKIEELEKNSINSSVSNELYNKLANDKDSSNKLITSKLFQNAPNPFTEKTVIKYVIPENAQKASILIFNMQGTLMKSYDNLSNNGELTINGGELEAGMYMYSLIVDGKEIDTKKMILSK